MELGKIMIIDRKYANAEEYFTKAVPVWKAIPGHHNLYTHLSSYLVDVRFVSRKANIEKPKHSFSETLYDREAACHDETASVVPKKRGRPSTTSTNAFSKKTHTYSKSWGAILAVDQFELDDVFKRYLDTDPF